MTTPTETTFVHARVFDLPKLQESLNRALVQLLELGCEIVDIKLTSYGEGASATVLAMIIYRREETAHE